MDTLGLEEIKQIFTPLIWSHVSVKTGNKYSANSCQLLNNVSGMARSGEILAIIGASGVGKSYTEKKRVTIDIVYFLK